MVLRSVKRRRLDRRPPFLHVNWSLSLGYQSCFPRPLSALCQPQLWVLPELVRRAASLRATAHSSWFRVASEGLFGESAADYSLYSLPLVSRHTASPPQKLHRHFLTRHLASREPKMKACRLPALPCPLPCPAVPEFWSGGGGRQAPVLAEWAWACFSFYLQPTLYAQIRCDYALLSTQSLKWCLDFGFCFLFCFFSWAFSYKHALNLPSWIKQDPREPTSLCLVRCEVGEAVGKLRVEDLARTLQWDSLGSGWQLSRYSVNFSEPHIPYL